MKGDQISTKLIVENETDCVNRVEYETMTEEEKILSEYAENLMDDKSEDTDDIDETESSVEFNPSSMIRDVEESSGELGEQTCDCDLSKNERYESETEHASI